MQSTTVIGVVDDVRHTSLEESPASMIYMHVSEAADGYIVVRASRAPKIVVAEIRSVLHAIDPNLAAADIQTMGQLESAASARRRFQTSLPTVFAAVALLLALIGLYGLIAHSVGRPHTRNRHTNGPRRKAVRRDGPYDEESCSPTCPRSRVRSRRFLVRGARHAGISLWSRGARASHDLLCLRFARWRDLRMG